MKMGRRLRVEDIAMLGPGEYVPDATEGISRVEDLPKPRIEPRSRNDGLCSCGCAVRSPAWASPRRGKYPRWRRGRIRLVRAWLCPPHANASPSSFYACRT